MIDVEHRALRAFKHHRLAVRDGLIQQQGSVGNERRHTIADGAILGEDLVRIQRLAVEQRVRDGVLLAAGVLDMLLQQRLVEQVLHAQAAARHLVFVGGTNAARRGANLHASRRVLRSQLDQPVIGKNHVRAVADEQVAVNVHTGRAQRVDFLHEGERIEHDAVADDAAAALTQHAAGNQLQDKFLAMNGDSMSGVVAAGIARHHLEALGEHVDDLALALVAPLRADNHRSLASFQHSTPLSIAKSLSGSRADSCTQIACCCETVPLSQGNSM